MDPIKPAFALSSCLSKGLDMVLSSGSTLLIGGVAAGFMLSNFLEPTPYEGTSSEQEWINEMLSRESQRSRRAQRGRVVGPLLERFQDQMHTVKQELSSFTRQMSRRAMRAMRAMREMREMRAARVVNPLLERRQAEVLTVQSNSSAYNSHGHTGARAEHQHHQTDENDQDCGQHEESGGQEAGGSNGGGTGGDAGGQGSDNDEEDNSSDEGSSSDEEDNSSDEEDSSSYEISVSTDESSISELVESSSYDSSDSTCQLSISDLVESFSDFSSDSTLQLNISEDKILIGLFNSNSINKKQSRISKLINKFNLKVLSLTETRVTEENGDQRLSEISPGEFQVSHQPRVNKEGKSKKHTGGGVAILSSKKLQEERIRFESFEYVAVDLHHDKWDRPMQTVTVYRPPGGNDEDMRKFREDFQNLLKTFPEDDSILITGDFNIWVNDKTNKHAKSFKKLLRDNGLHQHVREPTHNRGNTLDLVITRNVNISTLRVKKTKKKTKNRNQLSDHYAVIFSASPASEITLKRKCTESPGTPSKKFKDSQK